MLRRSLSVFDLLSSFNNLDSAIGIQLIPIVAITSTIKKSWVNAPSLSGIDRTALRVRVVAVTAHRACAADSLVTIDTGMRAHCARAISTSA